MKEKMVKVLSEMFTGVKEQMDDNHAYYFDAKDAEAEVEVKVEKLDGWISYKKEGSEDWTYISDMEGWENEEE